MAKWFETRRARGGIAVLAYAISVASNFFTSRQPLIGSGLVLLAVVWSVYLFWPEIKSLRIRNPPNVPAESPVWLYIFGVVALGMVIFAGERLYFSSAHEPRLLTSEEFANPYIQGKYFKLADLADSHGSIDGRTFADCWIYGPAAIVLRGNNDISKNNVFSGTKDDVFMVLNEGTVITDESGFIVLNDCKFRNCHFSKVTFFGGKADVARWKDQNYGPGERPK